MKYVFLVVFFLAGGLCINILIREEGWGLTPKQNCYTVEGSVAHPKKTLCLTGEEKAGPDHRT